MSGDPQPSTHLVRLFDAMQVLNQPEPGGMTHIGCVGRREPVGARRGPHGGNERIDQGIPGATIAGGHGTTTKQADIAPALAAN